MGRIKEYMMEISEDLGFGGEFTPEVEQEFKRRSEAHDRKYKRQLPRDADGKYPVCAWPGGYPIFYMAADDSVVCAGCANGDAYRTWDDTDAEHLIVARDINYEDASLFCDDCQERIESAYAEDVIEETEGSVN